MCHVRGTAVIVLFLCLYQVIEPVSVSVWWWTYTHILQGVYVFYSELSLNVVIWRFHVDIVARDQLGPMFTFLKTKYLQEKVCTFCLSVCLSVLLFIVAASLNSLEPTDSVIEWKWWPWKITRYTDCSSRQVPCDCLHVVTSTFPQVSPAGTSASVCGDQPRGVGQDKYCTFWVFNFFTKT